jgi:integrase
LLDRVRWHLRVKHYSVRTETAYIDWIRRFILFHTKRHPDEMGEEEIAAFLTNLAVEKQVAASTQNQALSALLFLYQQVLERKLGFLDNIQRVKRPPKIPVVFTRGEAQAVLDQLRGSYQLMGELLYGSGLRLLECLRLRVKDIDFGYGQITVRDGKGMRERVTVLPERVRGPLQLHLRGVRDLHAGDLARRAGRVYLPSRSPANIRGLRGSGSGNMFFRLPASRWTRVHGSYAVTTSLRKTCKTQSERPLLAHGSRKRPAATLSDIASLPTCLKADTTSVPCRNCSAIATSPPR